MTDLTSLGNFVNDLSSQGAAWYQGITGAPVAAPVLAIQREAGAGMVASNVLSNPLILFMLLAALVAIVYFAER